MHDCHRRSGSDFLQVACQFFDVFSYRYTCADNLSEICIVFVKLGNCAANIVLADRKLYLDDTDFTIHKYRIM